MAASNHLLTTAKLRVSMGDVDAARIIYFVAPQRWKEWLFTGWLQEIGRPLVSLIEGGHAVPTVSTRAEYHAPLRLDDHVRAELHAERAGRSSFSVRGLFFRTSDDVLCVEVTSSHVWARIDGGGSRPVQSEPLPDWLRVALTSSMPTNSEV